MHSPKGSYNFEKISSIYHSWCKFLSALAFIRVLILVTEKDTNPHAIIWTAVQISSARSGHMVRKYYPGMQITQWDKGPLTSPALLSFVLKVPVRYLCPSKIHSVPCDPILQRAYWPALSQSKWSNILRNLRRGKIFSRRCEPPRDLDSIFISMGVLLCPAR